MAKNDKGKDQVSLSLVLNGRFLLLLVCFFCLSACCPFKQAATVSDLKARYECLEISENMEWKTVQDAFKDPDETPRPDAQSLHKNLRAYHDRIVIFHTDLKESEIDGKRVFREVVTRVEVCRCR